MNNDKQLKHFVWWLVKTVGKLPERYRDFTEQPLSEDVCRDIDELVKYVKANY